MMQESAWDRVKYKVYGVVLIAICISLISLSLAMYNQSFKEFKSVKLLADRAGLQMFEGNRVKIDGVDAGYTGKIENLGAGEGVEIELKLLPDMIDKIPVNVEVTLEQLTAFGNKAVQMTRPDNPSPEHLKEGDTLDVRNNAVEINSLLQSLADVLEVAEPAKLNAALGNVATALEGNGDTLGETVTAAVDYLRKFNAGGTNGDLGNLQETFRVVDDFSNLYADIAPDLSSALGNASTTFNTLTRNRAGLSYFFDELVQIGIGAGDTFNALSGFESASRSMVSTGELLGRYAPGLTCFIQGADILEEQQLPAWQKQIRAHLTLSPGVEPYRNPRDLPIVAVPADKQGPKCYGLPYVEGGEEYLTNGGIEPRGHFAQQENTPPGLMLQPATELQLQLFGNGNPVGSPPNYPAGGGN